MAAEQRSSGEQIPAANGVIELRVRDSRHLFHSLDPAPLHRKHLDPDAEEYIVSRAKKLFVKTPSELVIHLDRPAGIPEEGRVLEDAIHAHFTRRAHLSRRHLRQLLRRGWYSLIIGMALLVASVIFGESISRRLGRMPLATVLRESLLIGGWVAMSRPMEILLYDWWTFRGEQRGFEWLSQMPVRTVYATSSAGAAADEKDDPKPRRATQQEGSTS